MGSRQAVPLRSVRVGNPYINNTQTRTPFASQSNTVASADRSFAAEIHNIRSGALCHRIFLTRAALFIWIHGMPRETIYESTAAERGMRDRRQDRIMYCFTDGGRAHNFLRALLSRSSVSSICSRIAAGVPEKPGASSVTQSRRVR